MSIKNLPTLKGVFPQPKPPPKRDFIKENRQKLRALQRFTLPRKENSEIDEHCTRRSQQRESHAPRSHSIPAKRISSGCSCASKQTQSTSTMTSGKQSTRTLSCDKGIQTEDIDDETFLAEALRRCSTRSLRDQIYNDRGLLAQSSEHIPEPIDLNSPDLNILDVDLRQINDDNCELESQQHAGKSTVGKSFPGNTHTTIRDECNNKGRINERTSNRSDHKVRKDIRIPKYLEREKREKELQRIREMGRDPNCPEGHYVLGEEERKAALAEAEKRFRHLVNELNRMPMSGETLRIRTRKMEIEKALIDLENTIRKFSKPKVYVRADN